jgi:hypothetical protein
MPEVGSITVRILPPVKGSRLFQWNRIHRIGSTSFSCPVPLINGKWDRTAVPCPVCDYYSELWKIIEKLEKTFGTDCEESLSYKEEARAIKPVEWYYYNAIVRSMFVEDVEAINCGPKILSVGSTLHQTIIRAIVGDSDDSSSRLGNIADLKTGRDFVIRKEVTAGGDGWPKYERSSFARNPSRAGTDQEIEFWTLNLHDLTTLRLPAEQSILEQALAEQKLSQKIAFCHSRP